MTARILQRLLPRLVAGAALWPVAAHALDAPPDPDADIGVVAAADAPQSEPVALRQDTSLRGSAAAGETGPLFVTADRLDSDGPDAVIATGGVEARRAGENFFADWLRYDTRLGEVQARGHIRLEQPQMVLTGDTLALKLDAYSGTLSDARFFLLGRPGRGAAVEALFRDRDHVSLSQASYTTCPVDNEDWRLRVGTLDLDKSREVGSARDARLEFLGVPILYAPSMDFPLDDARKSGFLAPTFGTSARNGVEFLLPYYLNLAPNYDATLAPRLLSRRGLQLGGEFRHLQEDGAGNVRAEYLPGDQVANRDRWGLFLNESYRVDERIQLAGRFERVSDNDYFRDLSTLVNLTSQVHLDQEFSARYQGEWWQASLLAQRYQTLQDPASPVVKPYARLPSLSLAAARDLPGGLEFGFAGEATRFDHPTATSGDRVWSYPTLKLPLANSWGFVTPKLGLHSTAYRLDTAYVPGGRTDITRNVPIVSLDTGVFLDRPFSFLGRDYQQSLEPRAYYVYAPARDQTDIPVFDTALLDFSYAQIFTENQFIGADRINDANQLTLAATTRFVEADSALERLRLTLGQRFYFGTQSVTLPGMPPRSSSATDLLLAASGQITRDWRIDSLMQYDTNAGRAIRQNFSAAYRPEPGRTLNLGYRFIDQSTRQADVSAQWPLSDRWYGMFRWNYSFRDNKLVEGVAGFEYNAGCWVARGALQRIATRADRTTDTFFIQLELNGLGRIGSNPLDVLRYSIPGYQTSNEITPP